MKKILLTALLLTAFAGYSQVKDQQKDDKQPGDIIVESYKGELNNKQEKDVTSGDISDGTELGDEPINFAALQVKPEFPGGIAAFRVYLTDNVQKDKIDKDADGITLKCLMSFIVERDGSLTGIKILRDPGYGFGTEIERILKGLKTKWKPGIQNGKPVRSSYLLPIVYTFAK